MIMSEIENHLETVLYVLKWDLKWMSIVRNDTPFLSQPHVDKTTNDPETMTTGASLGDKCEEFSALLTPACTCSSKENDLLSEAEISY
jgi:hypothetical protein